MNKSLKFVDLLDKGSKVQNQIIEVFAELYIRHLESQTGFMKWLERHENEICRAILDVQEGGGEFTIVMADGYWIRPFTQILHKLFNLGGAIKACEYEDRFVDEGDCCFKLVINAGKSAT